MTTTRPSCASLSANWSALIEVYQQRDWEYRDGIINAARVIVEQVCQRYRLDPLNFETAKDSPFQ